MVSLENFKNEIASKSVGNHSFKTFRKTWNEFEILYPFLKELNNQIFGESEFVILSRNNVKETTDLKLKVVKAIYWGFPTANKMEGNFSNILYNLDSIVYQLNRVISVPENLRESILREKLLSEKNHLKGL